MTLTVLLGDSAIATRQLRHLLRAHDCFRVERLDAAEVGVIDIIGVVLSQSLFTPVQVIAVDNLDKLTGANLDIFISAVLDSNNYIYAMAENLNPAQRKTLTSGLGDKLIVCDYPALDGKRGSETLDLISLTVSVSLSREVSHLLLERVGHDSARLQSIIEQCHIGGIRKPTVAQINVLCGTTNPVGVPWDISDYLERGDLHKALSLCSFAVPLATLAYLGNRYQQAMLIIESGATNPEEAAKASGSKSAYSAERLLSLSRRVGRERLAEIITILADGDLLAKQHGIDGLRVIIGRIVPLFSRQYSLSHQNS